MSHVVFLNTIEEVDSNFTLTVYVYVDGDTVGVAANTGPLNEVSEWGMSVVTGILMGLGVTGTPLHVTEMPDASEPQMEFQKRVLSLAKSQGLLA